jgi:hypothetical protein
MDKTLLAIIQWVGIGFSGLFVYLSFKAVARSQKYLAESKASLEKMKQINKELSNLNAGICCKCKLPKELVCNDCLGVGEPQPVPPKYRSIDEPWEKK